MKKRNRAIAIAGVLCAHTTMAANIAWNPVVNNTLVTDVITAGTFVTAVNTTSDGAAPIIGTNAFIAVNGLGPAGTNAAGTFTTDTGDTDLNTVFASHTWGPGTWSFTVDVIAGRTYELQIFAAGDDRACCATRDQRFGDGNGNLSDDAVRTGGSSVVGTFTADGITQTVTVNPGTNNGTDPGISGYILRDVTVIPEPASVSLVALGGLAMMIRRRRNS